MPPTLLDLLNQALDRCKADHEAQSDDHNLAIGLRIQQAATLVQERDRQQAAAQPAPAAPSPAKRKR